MECLESIFTKSYQKERNQNGISSSQNTGLYISALVAWTLLLTICPMNEVKKKFEMYVLCSLAIIFEVRPVLNHSNCRLREQPYLKPYWLMWKRKKGAIFLRFPYFNIFPALVAIVMPMGYVLGKSEDLVLHRLWYMNGMSSFDLHQCRDSGMQEKRKAEILVWKTFSVLLEANQNIWRSLEFNSVDRSTIS